MKLTVEELNASYENFSKLISLSSVAPNIKIRLARIGAIIESEMKAVNEQRLALFQKYGKSVEGKDEWTMEGVDKGVLASFNSSMKALMAEEIPLPGAKIKAEFLANVPELHPIDYIRLSWLIDIGEDKAEEKEPHKLAAVK